ncbi:MAG: hypothetical protein QM538_07145 [Methylacidiphilales bacterium]|nr:hypothetical protein [Candidatus Methylacidiphilales bacterium]
MRVRLNKDEQTNLDLIEVRSALNNKYLTISKFGAHVLDWFPILNAPSILWKSDVDYKSFDPIRGGIPICFPWFATREGYQNHGYARVQDWNIKKITTTLTTVSVQLSTTVTDKTNRLDSYFLTLLITASSESNMLHQELTILNTSDHSVTCSGGFHTYYAISDINTVTLTGLSGASYFNKVNGKYESNQLKISDLSCLDRVYRSNDMVQLIDSSYQYLRKITINKIGLADWVIWNPLATTKNFSDITMGSELHFICIEPAQVDPVTLGANQTLVWKQSITVSDVS